MSEEGRSLEDLKDVMAGADAAPSPAASAEEGAPAAPVAEDIEVIEPKIDELGRAYATGRRKTAVARVWIKRGSGRITINGKTEEEYFARPVLRMLIRQPLHTTERNDEFDVIATVRGSGLSGQAGAVRHGISRALVNFEPTLRATLKPGKFMTRDSRAVERKKYGKAKARKSFQFSKR